VVSTTAVPTLFNPLNIFVQQEFWYFPWDTTENAFTDAAQCACDVSRDLCEGGKFSHIFEIY